MVSVVSPHDPPWVSVVIPTLNEAENLHYVLPKIPTWVKEVLIVDGNSVDGTVEVARRLHPKVRVILQTGRGKGAALRCGFNAARGDIIVMLDADGSTDPAEIPAFVGILRAGADYVKGSRFIQGGGSEDITFIRQLGNRLLTIFVRLAFGCQFSDLCYGYNAFWSQYLPVLNPDSNGFEIETTLNLRAFTAGLKVAEVPSFEALRKHGESHLKAIPDGWRILRTILSEIIFTPQIINEGGFSVADASRSFPPASPFPNGALPPAYEAEGKSD
ncbi:MAG: glycosyltransferase family 2 protein [Chloroflexi bacterium]|nr:glycosyltransferase family 2 protein [Chloroflexota bacterium]